LKEARDFREGSIERKRERNGADIRTIPQAVQKWLDICEQLGRDGRGKVEPETLKQYKRRAAVILEYDWTSRSRRCETASLSNFEIGFLRIKPAIWRAVRYQVARRTRVPLKNMDRACRLSSLAPTRLQEPGFWQ
jgi:hypothetical protein